jgi:sugar-phosphatase
VTQPVFPTRRFGAILFDMDGTLLSSIAATERVWAAWARRRGLDVETFLPSMHGMRAIEILERVGLAELDLEEEVRALEQAELDDVDGIEAIAGAAAFLKALPADRWAVVTSATRKLAERRIAAALLPPPPLLISSDDVRIGKPAPDGFLMAAARLGHPIKDCLIFEDSGAGVRAAEAAGAAVIVISATHAHPMKTCHPRVSGFQMFRVTVAADGGIELRLEGLGPQ